MMRMLLPLPLVKVTIYKAFGRPVCGGFMESVKSSVDRLREIEGINRNGLMCEIMYPVYGNVLFLNLLCLTQGIVLKFQKKKKERF
jgi:hypothetical protein